MITDLIDIRVDYTYSMVEDVTIAIDIIRCCFVVAISLCEIDEYFCGFCGGLIILMFYWLTEVKKVCSFAANWF